MTCLACSTTSFSTQPPDTEPTNSPSSEMAILAPGRRGAEPYACTTVATATFLPASRQRSISGRSSFMSYQPSAISHQFQVDRSHPQRVNPPFYLGDVFHSA